jgi:hypothetical protein
MCAWRVDQMFYVRISLLLFILTILSSCYAGGPLGVIQKASDGVDLLKAGATAVKELTKDDKKNN